jgi:hypothetical protein
LNCFLLWTFRCCRQEAVPPPATAATPPATAAPPPGRPHYMAGWATTPNQCLVLPSRSTSQSEGGIMPVRSNSQSEGGILPARCHSQSDGGILHARPLSQSDGAPALCQYGGQAGQQMVHGRKSSHDEKEVGGTIQ